MDMMWWDWITDHWIISTICFAMVFYNQFIYEVPKK